MATSRLNPILESLSGRFGNVVFSARFGKTVLSRRPATGAREFTPAQLSQQEKIRLAGYYVKAVVADPQAVAPYAEASKQRKTPLAGLISGDFLNSPEVTAIDLTQYTRQPGSKIIVSATDDFEVIAVDVQINDSNGNQVEAGAAVKSPENPGRWVYTATAQVAAGESFSVVAAAADRPGNIGLKTETVQ